MKNFNKRFVLSWLLLWWCHLSLAQSFTIEGPSCVISGVTYTYTFTGAYPTNPGLYAVIQGGLITGGTASTVSVIWTGGSVTDLTIYYTAIVKKTVAVASNGSIALSSMTVDNGVITGASISGPTASAGGCIYNYQWQSGTTTSFSSINGATAKDYTLTNGTAATLTLRRYVNAQGNLTNIGYSNVLSLQAKTVLAGQSPGVLTPAPLTLCTGGTPQYRWDVSTDLVNWTEVRDAESLLYVQQTYNPGALTASRYYRETITCDGAPASTNIYRIIVTQPLTAGTINGISATIPYAGLPGALTSQALPTGGACGSYTYQWQQSVDGVNYTNIPGVANEPSYSPENLYRQTWFRRAVSCAGQTLYSNVVTLQPAAETLYGGSISPSSIFLTQTANNFLLSPVRTPRGGCWNGAYTYQWQRSTDNINFVNITGATAASYQTGVLDKTTFFRRMVSCGGQTAYSNTAYVKKAELENYVREVAAQAAGLADNLETQTDAIRTVRQATGYYDGLGRLSQQVIKKGALVTGQSPFDMGLEKVYDAMGREADQYLPYASTGDDGTIKINPRTQQQAFYTSQLSTAPGGAGTDPSYAYNHTVFEQSPLNRVKEAFIPGASWAGTAAETNAANRHSVKFSYLSNTVTDAVRSWSVTDVPGALGAYATAAAYPAGTLYKHISQDENGQQVVEFKDKDGNVILRKTSLTATDPGTGAGYTGWLSTYYIYDNFQQLRCVIQPEGVKTLQGNGWAFTTTLLDEQCFRYEYDGKQRMIFKKVPGSGLVSIVYDIRDRQVMMQDAGMRQAGKWLVTLYDSQNRPVQTGLWNETHDQAWHAAAATTAAYPFTPAAAPATGYERLTQTGYDTYAALPTASGLNSTFDNGDAAQFYTAYNTSPEYAQPLTASQLTTGLVTWTETKVLNSNPVKYLYAVNVYDDKGRVIQVKSTNNSGGTDVATTQYSWNSQPLILANRHAKAGTNPQTMTVVTRNTRDDLDRIIKVEKKVQHSLVNSNAMGNYITVAEMEYDALGKVRNLKTGRGKDANGNYTTTPLETLATDYTLQGWQAGVNRSYLAAGASGHYFGWELGYDKTANYAGQAYSKAQFNGNISGMIWRSKGNGIQRMYDFTYDAANRLLKGAFVQRNADNTWSNSLVNYDMKMGDGADPNLAYDANGNILRMQRWGLKSGASVLIDDMTYTYYTGSNRLRSVAEQGSGAADHKLGDFTDKSTSADDYGYDLNGNMVTDLNRRINGSTGTGLTSGGAITYNYLNLPEAMVVKDDNGNTKGTITFTYDATGNRLAKKVEDVSQAGKTITTITAYMGNALYESVTNTADAAASYSDRLQSWSYGEGRIRFKPAAGSVPARFDFDYFLKDHLGDVRMVLTDEQQTDIYQATMETANLSFEQALFGDKVSATNTAKPGAFDSDGANAKVSAVNGTAPENRVGPGVILKVMAGDKINAKAFAWYQPSGMDNTTDNTLQHIVTNLLAQLTPGIAAIGKGTAAGAVTNTVLQPGMENFLLTQQPESGAPRAYLNWVLLDEEQFKFVGGGVTPVPQITGSQGKQLLQANSGNDIEMARNGYVYVYVSNESKGNVYFDDIRIDHKRGPLLEETHYYPFGLPMAAISGKAAGKPENRFKYNGKEIQHKEFADGSGLEMYDFKYRLYDMQLGVFHNQDRLADKYAYMSPYQFCSNNPIWLREIDGLEGAKYTDVDEEGKKRTVVEKNIVVLLERKQDVPANASEKKKARIDRQNKRTEQRNNEKLEAKRTELNTYYNGADGKGAKTTSGEQVYFKFNVTGVADIKKKGMKQDQVEAGYRRISMSNGIAATKTTFGTTQDLAAPAAVLTREGARGDFGSTRVNIMRLNFNAPAGTTAHEVLHTFGLDDNGYTKGGLLASPPEQISSSEVDQVIQNSYDKK